jgi:hypothetical protein
MNTDRLSIVEEREKLCAAGDWERWLARTLTCPLSLGEGAP